MLTEYGQMFIMNKNDGETREVLKMRNSFFAAKLHMDMMMSMGMMMSMLFVMFIMCCPWF